LKRIAERQHEARDPVGDAKLLQALKRLWIGSLGACGREGEQDRLAHQLPEAKRARADDQETHPEKDRPEDHQRQVEAAHELAEGDENAEAVGRHGRGDRRKHCERSRLHHIAGDLQHHVRDLLDHLLERLGALAERGNRNAREDREHHDLQDLVVGHGLDGGFRHQMRDEFLQSEPRRLQVGGRIGVRDRKVETHAGLQDVHHHHAEQERDQRGADKPAHGLEPDAAERRARAHMGDADDQRGEHQGCDDHLDQAQEQICDERDVASDRRCRFRVRKCLMTGVADRYSEHQADENQSCEVSRHRPLRAC